MVKKNLNIDFFKKTSQTHKIIISLFTLVNQVNLELLDPQLKLPNISLIKKVNFNKTIVSLNNKMFLLGRYKTIYFNNQIWLDNFS